MARIQECTSWIYVGILCVLHSITGITGLSVSACFNTTQKALEVSCGAGYMLRIRASFYGHSPRGACSFSAGDCTQAEHEQYPCMGSDYCRINLPSGNFGQKIPICDKYSTYFQVEYECEPAAQTHDICRTSRLTAQHGYISTSRYPSNYRDTMDCLTQISVNPNQKINLTIIDMDLEMNGTHGCHDWMYAFNKYRSVTLCGRRTNEKLFSLQSNEISIRFQTNGRNTRKGFWIFYEAYPPLVTTTPYKETPSWNIPVTKESTVLPAAPTTTLTTTTSQENLPFVAIVSGVIGTLTFILIVLLILLAVKWWREKKQTSYKRDSKDLEYLDARNPAFRSSTGTEFQGVEIYYNC